MIRAKNKSEFIRKLSQDLSAADAVEKAHTAGFKDTTVKDVYRVRTILNRLAGKEPKSRGGARPTVVSDSVAIIPISRPPQAILPSSNIRQMLVDAVLEIGLRGVEQELETIRDRLRAAST